MSGRLGSFFEASPVCVGLRNLFNMRSPGLVVLAEGSVYNLTNTSHNTGTIGLRGKDAVCINVTHNDSPKAITYTAKKVMEELSTPVLSLSTRSISEQVLTKAHGAGVRDFIAPSVASFQLMKHLTRKLSVAEEDDIVNLGVELSLDAPKNAIDAVGGIRDLSFIITSPGVDLITAAPVLRKLKSTHIPVILRFPAPPDSSKQVLLAKQIERLPISWAGLEESKINVVETEGVERTTRDIKRLMGVVAGVAIAPGENHKLTEQVFKDLKYSFSRMNLK